MLQNEKKEHELVQQPPLVERNYCKGWKVQVLEAGIG